MMNILAIGWFSQCWKAKNQSLKLTFITFCKKLPNCDRSGSCQFELTSMLKHIVRVNDCCLQFWNSKTAFENSRVRFRKLPGYNLFNSSFYNLRISLVTMNDKFVSALTLRHISRSFFLTISLQFMNHFCSLLGYFE